MGDDRRIDLLLKSFYKWVNKFEGDDQQTSLDALENAIDACLMSMIKSQKMMSMNEAELSHYNELYHEIEQDIKKTSGDIEKISAAKKTAKQVRCHREQYHALSKIIAEEKDRNETTKDLAKAEIGMLELNRKREQLAARIEQHRRQFQVLLSAVQQLQVLNGKDEESLEEGEMHEAEKLEDLSEEDTIMSVE